MRRRRAHASRVSRRCLRDKTTRTFGQSVVRGRGETRREKEKEKERKISTRRDHLFTARASSSIAPRDDAHRVHTHLARRSRTCVSNGFAIPRAGGAFAVGSGAEISNGFDIRRARASLDDLDRARAPRRSRTRLPRRVRRRARRAREDDETTCADDYNLRTFLFRRHSPSDDERRAR